MFCEEPAELMSWTCDVLVMAAPTLLLVAVLPSLDATTCKKAVGNVMGSDTVDDDVDETVEEPH